MWLSPSSLMARGDNSKWSHTFSVDILNALDGWWYTCILRSDKSYYIITKHGQECIFDKKNMQNNKKEKRKKRKKICRSLTPAAMYSSIIESERRHPPHKKRIFFFFFFFVPPSLPPPPVTPNWKKKVRKIPPPVLPQKRVKQMQDHSFLFCVCWKVRVL